ncbi:unnamed protein product [Caenorhabditis brenneri]
MLGIVFATVEILVYPNVHNYKDSLFFFSTEELFGFEGDWIRNIPLTIYTFVHASTMSLLSVQFIYRYWAIFDGRKLIYFKRSHCFIWVVYCSLFGCQYSLGSLYFFQRDQVTDDYLQQEILIGYNAKISELPGLTILAYDPVDGSIAMPTIILFIPIFIMMCLPVFNLNVSIPSGVMLCCFTLYPATDSIIVMYVVSEYRVRAKRIKTVLFDSVKKLQAVRVDAVSGPASWATPCN